MANTYTLLETITVGAAGASSVTFNSIPQTGYTDLVIKMSVRTDRTSANQDSALISFNGLTTNFTNKTLEGGGNTPAASSFSSARFLGSINDANNTASTFSNLELYVPNYTSANFKSFSTDSVMENNATFSYVDLTAGLWSNTAAITSVSITPGTGPNFVQHSTFSLYGVSALGVTPTKAPKATGGSIIQTDGTYWYHAFLSSGTFTPATALSCDVLVVAGGGGGAANQGGGAGAGGVFYATSQSLSSAKTVTVGGGGAGGVENVSLPTIGNNSQITGITAAVGGGIGGADNTTGAVANGGTGGSGGGGLYNGTGGSATSGQGNAGGNGGSGSLYFGGGGGGGAGAVGGNYVQPNAGAGGAGTNTYSSWLSTTGLGLSGYIAGGGGGGGSSQHVYNTTNGGAGGSGGGGTGGNGTASASAGIANTGGGGAGGGRTSTSFPGTAGGSGVVIIRYLA